MEKGPWMFDDIVEAYFVISNISIFYSEFDEKKQMLPKNKDTLLIFYCGRT